MYRDRRQKKRGNQQWKVWYGESGGREYQKHNGEYGRVCKTEEGHRVTEIRRSSASNTFIAYIYIYID